jgi:ligand-binding sensor domain-containing protein/signal transduction histidine kinase
VSVVRLSFYPRFLVAIAGAVLLRLPLSGAPGRGDLAVQTWSLEQGLPDSTVTAIAQTNDGYLWVGTFNGLARFDGVRFVAFNPGNTPALKHARVQRLYVDARGTLWINTYDGALISFRDGIFSEEWKGEGMRPAKVTLVPTHGAEIMFAFESGELIRRPLDAKAPGKWQVLHPPVEHRENALYLEDEAGALWCLTRNRRVWRLDGDTFTPMASEKTLGSIPRRLVTDQAGRMWVSTDRDIFRWSGTHFESMGASLGSESPQMDFLFFPREEGRWTIANGRFRKEVDGRCTQEVPEWRDLLGGDYPIYQQMHQDRHGGIWFAPPHRGVFYLSPEGESRQLNTTDGLPTDFISSWFEDREGNIWLGAERGGLIRLHRRRFQTLALGGDQPSAPAISVCEDRENAIWVGTFGNGLVRASQGRTEQLLTAKQAVGRHVLSVVPDAAGRLWASAGAEDLHQVVNGELKPAPWAAHGIKALFVDHLDRLWVGTKDQLFCAAAGKLNTFDTFSGGNRHEVRSIAEDRAGGIWVGLGDGTLYRYDENRFIAFKPDDIPVSYPIWSLSPDEDGTLWVGTFGGGLLLLQDGKFFRYTKKAGLPDDVISQILDDGSGNLWIGSSRGVFRVSKEALRAFRAGRITTVPSLVFGRHEGLPSLECTGGYQPSAWRGRDGTLWFATAGGVAYVDPSKLAANASPPSVTIESVVVDGGVQALPSAARADAPTGRATPPVLEIPAGGKRLEFQYTGLCFASPDQVRFRHRLEGLESAWNDVGPRRFAQYSFLRPGRYRFLVSACNSDGVWNETGAAIVIKVLPHFWQTWWFVGLFGMTTVGALAAAVHRVSTAGLRRKVLGLERQRAIEADRARIARDIHDELGAGLTQITLFSELLRRAPHDHPEEHARHISETANSLTLAMDEIVWAVNPKNDTLENSVSYICSFAQEYLRTAGVKCRLEIPAAIPSVRLSSEVRYHVFVSTKEALNNIVKHAGATEVWLRLALETRAFILTIEDNGCGLRTESPPSEPSNARISSGNGFGNLQTRMKTVGGTFTLTAGAEGRGIRIALKIPYENESPVSPS